LNEIFSTIIVELKNKPVLYNFKHVLRSINRPLPIIICGGGKNYIWYVDEIRKAGWELKNILAEKLNIEIMPIGKFMSNTINDHRLLIAYTLAHRVEDLPQLNGFPWHFPEISDNSVEGDTRDRFYSLQDLQNEMYGGHS
jgi:hypothetical protein